MKLIKLIDDVQVDDIDRRKGDVLLVEDDFDTTDFATVIEIQQPKKPKKPKKNGQGGGQGNGNGGGNGNQSQTNGKGGS